MSDTFQVRAQGPGPGAERLRPAPQSRDHRERSQAATEQPVRAETSAGLRAQSHGLRRAAAGLVLAGSLATSGCLFGGKPKPPRVFVPPPVAAKVPPEPAPPVLPPAPDLEPPVEAPASVAGTGTLPSPPAPPKPAPPVKPPKAPETTATVTPPPPEPPKPAQIFSPEEQRAYSRQFEESMDRVRGNLALLEGRNLTAEQRDVVKQIRTFQIQAEQARGSDLLTAVNLARRADLLAKDLLGRLP